MNPYSDLPASAFWRNAVASKADPKQISGLWQPRFQILPDHRVSTYGSCFAQHIGRSLRARGFNWFTPEVPPFQLSDDLARTYNYGIFSSRTANIYTATLLLQWAKWAFGIEAPPAEVWTEGDRVIDPFRPRIEPEGFASAEEMTRLRAVTLENFRRSVTEAQVFVFTLGLTERWVNTREGYEYPMCPGTAGGTFDASLHAFENLNYEQICAALDQALAIFRQHNPDLRILLTVSPVPLTATASGQHVLTATMRSKAVLRTVADHFVTTRDWVDYFPSYEIISSPVFRGAFFEPNLRGIHPDGVAFVMDSFFADMAATFGTAPAREEVRAAPDAAEDEAKADVVCEEELLAAFGVRK